MASPSLFAQPCEFIAGAATIDSLPPIAQPEIAFIGRSNAGKSSLINALVNRNSLARTSQNPGHTKQLNFFLLAERLLLVDMPGYGYAKVSKEKKGQWDRLITDYLRGRPTLRRTCVLIDARRGIMPPDTEFMELLDESAASFQAVLTKADALSQAELSAVLQSTEKSLKSHAAAHPKAIVTSSLKKLGIESLQEELAPFAG